MFENINANFCLGIILLLLLNQIISKKISLRKLIYGSEMDKELKSAYSVLMQISGYKIYNALAKEFSGKFE